jgi:ER degradation enhancer, mannosidase alpha-like 3
MRLMYVVLWWVLVGLCVEISTQQTPKRVMPPDEVIRSREEVRNMFYHSFGSYMKYAFPADELRPLGCTGRWRNESNRGEMDDAMGLFSLTLIDSLSTVAVIGTHQEFEEAVWLVVRNVGFDTDVVVSVFEVCSFLSLLIILLI